MKRKLIIPLVLIVALAAAGAYSMGWWFHRDAALQGSGTVEARNIRVGSKIGGRIDKVLVREGDTVVAGQLLITFDDKELQASLAQSRANAVRQSVVFVPRKSPKPGPPPHRPKRNTSSGGMATGRKTLPRRRRISIVRPPTKSARAWTSSATTLWRKRTWFRSSNATPPKPTGRWRRR